MLTIFNTPSANQAGSHTTPKAPLPASRKKYRLLWGYALCLLWTGSEATGQSALFRPVHAGILYPVSNNGTEAPLYTNGASFHVLSGLSANERAFALSGVATIVRENADGLLISGVINHVGGGTAGVQIGGACNLTGGDVRGLQIAGALNKSRKATAQVAGFANIVHASSAVQVGGFLNRADTVNTQVSGFLNIARKVKGVQLSGFINIADSSDYPIGVLNLIKNGEKGLGISIDETRTTLLSFRSGGRVLYSLLGVGYRLENTTEDRHFAFESGLGARWDISSRFRLKGEMYQQLMTDFRSDARMKAGIRLLPALKLGKSIELFGGPSINYVCFENDEGYDIIRKYIWKQPGSEIFQGVHFGFTGGIQAFF